MVSRGGVCPVSWSQDAVGPIGRSVEDVMAVFDVIKGYDERDNTTAVTTQKCLLTVVCQDLFQIKAEGERFEGVEIRCVDILY